MSHEQETEEKFDRSREFKTFPQTCEWFNLLQNALSEYSPESVENVRETLNSLDMLDESTLVNTSGDGSLADATAALLGEKLAFKPGETDMIILHNTVKYVDRTGVQMERSVSLVQYGDRNGETAMAKTVGLPAAIVATLILQGKVEGKGILSPITRDVYIPALQMLQREGIDFHET